MAGTNELQTFLIGKPEALLSAHRHDTLIVRALQPSTVPDEQVERLLNITSLPDAPAMIVSSDNGRKVETTTASNLCGPIFESPEKLSFAAKG